MISLILKVIGPVVGIIATYYISRVVRKWVQYLVTEWEKKSSSAQDSDLSKEKARLDEVQKKNKVTVGELLKKKYGTPNSSSSTDH